MDMSKILTNVVTSSGETVQQISVNQPVLMVFLRHFGCTFCREALDEISKKKAEIENGGAKIVFVHMSDAKTADEYFKRFNIENPTHICDPNCKLYQQFGLVKGSFQQLFGFNVWLRGVEANIKHKYGLGRFLGDAFQMPGVFVIRNGTIREQYIHKQASDKPNYQEMAACCVVWCGINKFFGS